MSERMEGAANPFPAATRRQDPSKKHDLSDWLELHGLTASDCQKILSQSSLTCQYGNEDGRHPCNLKAELAWEISANALQRLYPVQSGLIEETKATTILNFSPCRAGPMTMPTDDPGSSIVVLTYTGRVQDLLTMAHEFGHALQAKVCRGKFVPPVNREICAFLSELALLDYLNAVDPCLQSRATAAWAEANNHYVGQCGHALGQALTKTSTSYRYGWNYAIARPLTSRAFASVPRRMLFGFFNNRVSLSGLVRFLGCGMRKNPSCDGACLTFMPGTKPEAGVPLF